MKRNVQLWFQDSSVEMLNAWGNLTLASHVSTEAGLWRFQLDPVFTAWAVKF